MRFRAHLLALLVLFGADARADSRTDFLLTRLRYPPAPGVADDFRVRTNAALVLGTLKDDRESLVPPLCSALNDPSEVVRQAVAVALRRLAQPTAAGCLKARASREPNEGVKLAIARAVEALEAEAPAPDTPKLNANAKYYVALAPIGNSSGRSQADVERIVLLAVRDKLDSLGTFQVAPKNESADAARVEMQKRKLKGFYLSFAVDKFDYSNGNLRVVVRLVVANYPGKAMQAMLSQGRTMTDTSPGDTGAEDQLLELAAKAAADQFAQNVMSF